MERGSVFLALRDLQVDNIRINYSGSGDSGAIDNVEFYDEDGDTIDGIDSNLEDSIRDIADSYLSDIEDWWNDNGGFGVMVINVVDGTYNIENNIYVTQTFDHDGNLDLD